MGASVHNWVKGGSIYLILAFTPGLSLPSKMSFKPHRKSHTDNPVQLPAPPQLHLHSSSHQTIDYIAKDELGSLGNLLSHYIGIHDPADGELKLVPARRVTVRRTLRPDVANALNNAEENPSPNVYSPKFPPWLIQRW